MASVAGARGESWAGLTTRLVLVLAACAGHSHRSYALNLAPGPGDAGRFSRPLLAGEVSHLPPFVLDANQKCPKLPVLAPPPPSIPKMPPKPPPLDVNMSSNPQVSAASTRKRRLVPLIPPIIPPIIPPLPLLPLPILPLIPPILPLPFIPNIFNPLKPIKIPSLDSLKKTELEKTLMSVGKVKPVQFPELTVKKNILDKLLDLKKKGSLTTAEFIRFKKLLLY